MYFVAGCSPRTRGLMPDRPTVVHSQAVFPAHAGIDVQVRALQSSDEGVPCARRD